MKNFNIFGLSEKSDFLEGFTKNQYKGGGGGEKLPKKGDLDSFAGLKEGLGKKEGGVWGADVHYGNNYLI